MSGNRKLAAILATDVVGEPRRPQVMPILKTLFKGGQLACVRHSPPCATTPTYSATCPVGQECPDSRRAT
jgi:hypothetical protein